MRNWKIGKRIIAGFAAVIAIAMVLGVYAYYRTTDIAHNESDMSVNYIPSIANLSEVNNNVAHISALLSRHAASSDQHEMEGLEGEMAAIREKNTELLHAYSVLPSDDDEKALYAKATANRAEYANTVEQIRQLSRLGTPEANKQALDMIRTQLLVVQGKYFDAIQAVLDYNIKGSKHNLLQIEGSVDGAKRGIIIGLLLAIACSIPITIFIVRSITEPMALVVAVIQKIEACDLSGTLTIDTQDEMGDMARALNSALTMLNQTLEEVSENASQATSSSQQLASAAESIASGAQEQAASLEETSASLEEITATVRQSADNAHQASQLASGSRDAAEKGRDVVSSAITAMTEINAASAKISDIISTIDEIAFQTNLLAVNAAVEAARAGEEGRGFAVVASEVRSLAQRSAGAAKEIKGLIQDSLKKVETGSALVNKSGETLEGIVGSVKRVTDIFGEIAASASEQSTGVEQVNTAVTQMDQVTQSNSAQTEELSATAQSLSEQAARLMEMVGAFTLRRKPGGPAFQTRSAAPFSASHSSHYDVIQPKKSKNGQPKNGAGSRAGKPKVIRQPAAPATALATAGGGVSDSSFEEF